MRACYNVQTCMESALEEDIRICREVGFQEIEISYAKADAFLKSHTMDELGRLVKDSGLTCASINAIFATSFCTPEKWERVRREYEYACELGEAVDAHKVIVLTDEWADLPENVTKEDIFRDTAEMLHKLADIGKPRGMITALEPVGSMAVGDAKTAYEIVKEVNREEVGMVVDDFNLFLYDGGSDFEEIAHIDKDKIALVHINDAEKLPFARIDQMHRCMPGDGRIDVKGYMDYVRATGYDGTVSVEILNPAIWARSPEDVILEAYQKMIRFL